MSGSYIPSLIHVVVNDEGCKLWVYFKVSRGMIIKYKNYVNNKANSKKD